jgi:hypothetical protein
MKARDRTTTELAQVVTRAILTGGLHHIHRHANLHGTALQ